MAIAFLPSFFIETNPHYSERIPFVVAQRFSSVLLLTAYAGTGPPLSYFRPPACPTSSPFVLFSLRDELELQVGRPL